MGNQGRYQMGNQTIHMIDLNYHHLQTILVEVTIGNEFLLYKILDKFVVI
jgi:hypothetical protein